MLDFGFYNMDCLEGMRQFPDNYFELAVVDPPYGSGGGTWTNGTRFGQRFDRYLEPGSGARHTQEETPKNRGGSRHYTFGARKSSRTYQDRRNMGEQIRKKIIAWDIAPGKEYFDELFRISRNQVIWGGNYFQLPPTRCFLVWRKLTISEKFSMAMAEYAWTSFNSNAKVFEHVPQDNTGQRFHPTQKPVALYKWILRNYAKPGDKILDTHVGSASSLIACYDLGFDYVGFEIDEEYYQLASKRLEEVKAQIRFEDLF